MSLSLEIKKHIYITNVTISVCVCPFQCFSPAYIELGLVLLLSSWHTHTYKAILYTSTLMSLLWCSPSMLGSIHSWVITVSPTSGSELLLWFVSSPDWLTFTNNVQSASVAKWPLSTSFSFQVTASPAFWWWTALVVSFPDQPTLHITCNLLV